MLGLPQWPLLTMLKCQSFPIEERVQRIREIEMLDWIYYVQSSHLGQKDIKKCIGKWETSMHHCSVVVLFIRPEMTGVLQ